LSLTVGEGGQVLLDRWTEAAKMHERCSGHAGPACTEVRSRLLPQSRASSGIAEWPISDFCLTTAEIVALVIILRFCPTTAGPAAEARCRSSR
jgi:hypothetical protein